MQKLDLSRVGCSDIPVITGDNKFGSQLDLWLRCKHGTEQDLPGPVLDSAALGRYHERGTALAVFERRLGFSRDDLPELVQPPSRTIDEGLRYSLDFVTGARFDGKWHKVKSLAGTRVIECKSRSERSMPYWPDPRFSGDIPRDVYVQIQAQMALIQRDRNWWRGTDIPDVTEIDLCVAMGGREIRHYEIKRDLAFGMAVVELAESWHERYVVGNERPMPTGECDEALDKIYPDSDGVIRKPTAEEQRPLEDWLAAREAVGEARDKLRAMEGKEKEAARRIKALVGSNEGLILNPYKAVKWGKTRGHARYKTAVELLVDEGTVQVEAMESAIERTRGNPYRALKIVKHDSRGDQ